MNYLDIILLIPILWGAYKGFTKGFIVAIASLIALLAGIYGALSFSNFTGGFLQENWDIQTEYLPVVAFAITFIAIVIAVHFVAKLVDKLVKAIALGWLNTIAGILFGVLKSIFVMSIIIFFIEKIDPQAMMIKKDFKEQSLLYEPIRKTALFVFPALEELQKKVSAF